MLEVPRAPARGTPTCPAPPVARPIARPYRPQYCGTITATTSATTASGTKKPPLCQIVPTKR